VNPGKKITVVGVKEKTMQRTRGYYEVLNPGKEKHKLRRFQLGLFHLSDRGSRETLRLGNHGWGVDSQFLDNGKIEQ